MNKTLQTSEHAYSGLLEEALDAGAFGELDQTERTILRLRAGVNDRPRDVEEIAVKLGQPQAWVGLVEEMLVDRLKRTRFQRRLERLLVV